MVKTKVSMTIDKDVFETFRQYCTENGMKISTKVEVLMKECTKNLSLKGFMKK
ncbi:hypothetical protein HQ529_00620 [Candidatus Woesearchaeota archaeon]|nr:hypothetical protein [Candidatus Woesearchaeota archaeon]